MHFFQVSADAGGLSSRGALCLHLVPPLLSVGALETNNQVHVATSLELPAALRGGREMCSSGSLHLLAMGETWVKCGEVGECSEQEGHRLCRSRVAFWNRKQIPLPESPCVHMSS